MPFFGKLLFWGLSSTTLFFGDLPRRGGEVVSAVMEGAFRPVFLFFFLPHFFFPSLWANEPPAGRGQGRTSRERRRWGLFLYNGILETLDSNSVSLSLTLLTHSIAWTGVWKLDPVFSECLQNVNTHTHLSPSPLSLPPLHACCRVFQPSWLVSFFLPPAISLLDTTWPPLASPQGSGCEMHNQCNIHGLNCVFFSLFFFNNYCTVCIFFSFFVCKFFFLPICI